MATEKMLRVQNKVEEFVAWIKYYDMELHAGEQISVVEGIKAKINNVEDETALRDFLEEFSEYTS